MRHVDPKGSDNLHRHVAHPRNVAMMLISGHRGLKN